MCVGGEAPWGWGEGGLATEAPLPGFALVGKPRGGRVREPPAPVWGSATVASWMRAAPRGLALPSCKMGAVVLSSWGCGWAQGPQSGVAPSSAPCAHL